MALNFNPRGLSKEKVVDYYEMKLFFGLMTFKIKPHFKREGWSCPECYEQNKVIDSFDELPQRFGLGK